MIGAAPMANKFGSVFEFCPREVGAVTDDVIALFAAPCAFQANLWFWFLFLLVFIEVIPWCAHSIFRIDVA